MKLTKKILKEMIKEELEKAQLSEDLEDQKAFHRRLNLGAMALKNAKQFLETFDYVLSAQLGSDDEAYEKELYEKIIEEFKEVIEQLEYELKP